MLEEINRQEKEILQKIRQALYAAKHQYTVKIFIHIYNKGKVVDIELLSRERIEALKT